MTLASGNKRIPRHKQCQIITQCQRPLIFQTSSRRRRPIGGIQQFLGAFATTSAISCDSICHTLGRPIWHSTLLRWRLLLSENECTILDGVKVEGQRWSPRSPHVGHREEVADIRVEYLFSKDTDKVESLDKRKVIRTFWNTIRAASSVVAGVRSAARTALKACASLRRVAISWAVV